MHKGMNLSRLHPHIRAHLRLGRLSDRARDPGTGRGLLAAEVHESGDELTVRLEVPGNFLRFFLTHTLLNGKLEKLPAYLKAHWPVEFMAALLSADIAFLIDDDAMMRPTCAETIARHLPSRAHHQAQQQGRPGATTGCRLRHGVSVATFRMLGRVAPGSVVALTLAAKATSATMMTRTTAKTARRLMVRLADRVASGAGAAGIRHHESSPPSAPGSCGGWFRSRPRHFAQA